MADRPTDRLAGWLTGFRRGAVWSIHDCRGPLCVCLGLIRRCGVGWIQFWWCCRSLLEARPRVDEVLRSFSRCPACLSRVALPRHGREKSFSVSAPHGLHCEFPHDVVAMRSGYKTCAHTIHTHMHALAHASAREHTHTRVREGTCIGRRVRGGGCWTDMAVDRSVWK